MSPKPFTLAAILAAAGIAACGGSSTSSSSAPPSAAAGASASGSSAASASSASAPSTPSDKVSAATGDIPDTQVFLTFRDPRRGVSVRYPEGWTQRRGQRGVSFVQNANQITLSLSQGGAPSPEQVRAQLQAERAHLPGLQIASATRLQLPGGPAVKATYSTQSAPDPVTGKHVTLLVDRYVFARSRRLAVLDLATAKGVDNVDAYRMISRSFRWL